MCVNFPPNKPADSLRRDSRVIMKRVSRAYLSPSPRRAPHPHTYILGLFKKGKFENWLRVWVSCADAAVWINLIFNYRHRIIGMYNVNVIVYIYGQERNKKNPGRGRLIWICI